MAEPSTTELLDSIDRVVSARGVRPDCEGSSKAGSMLVASLTKGSPRQRAAMPAASAAVSGSGSSRLRARRTERIDAALALVRAAGASSETEAATQLLDLAAALVLYRARLAATRSRREALALGLGPHEASGELDFDATEGEAMLRTATGHDDEDPDGRGL